MQLTLLRQGNPLALASNQIKVLESPESAHPTFASALTDVHLAPLRARALEVLQVNVGKLCNQTCTHCHVDAGPTRTEIMSRETMEACLRLIDRATISTVDITGGAPEMNPHFRWFVEQLRTRGLRVMDRCNLTILTANGFRDLPEFLASQEVEIVASLPCYSEENTDRQRGAGVFARSIEAIQRLNELGYGLPESSRILTLVYNPIGPALPPSQSTLEEAYRRELRARYGVEFTRLYTITNMPISRFLEDLLRTQRYDAYMTQLIAAFRPENVSGLMCRETLSVDWQGYLYDCDFNQMLELPIDVGYNRRIQDLDEQSLKGLAERPIITGRHCFGCTAGSGSSCGGALTK